MFSIPSVIRWPLATGFHGWRSWIVTSALSKARTRTPHHQRLANAGRNGRHSMKRVGREGYQGSPRFGRRVYLVRGVNLQFAALIIGRLGKLQYQRELAPPRCTAMVDVPVIMAGFTREIDRVLQRFESRQVKAISLPVNARCCA